MSDDDDDDIFTKTNRTEVEDLVDDNSVSSDDELLTAPSERDEVKEVQKMSSKDTQSVNLWRLAATLALLLTALSVTLATYTNLKSEEKNDFETAVSVVYVVLSVHDRNIHGTYRLSFYFSSLNNSPLRWQMLPLTTSKIYAMDYFSCPLSFLLGKTAMRTMKLFHL